MTNLPTGLRARVLSLAKTPEEALDALALEPQEAPTPGPGEVVVRVESAAVGWVDLLMTTGQYQHVPEPPYTPGLELAGHVAAVGPGVTLTLGARVMLDGLRSGPRSLSSYRAWGGFATYVLAPADALLPLPEALTVDEGACLLGGAETAYHALVARAHLRAGERLLVLGATGSTGLAAVALGKLLGATVIAAGRSRDKLAVVAREGADHVLCTADEAGAPRRFRDDLKALTGGAGVDVVYDAIGGETSVEALRGTAFGGRFVLVGWSSTPSAARGDTPANTLPTNLVLMKSIDVLGSPAAISVLRDPSVRAPRLEAILTWAREGKLHPLVSKAYPLGELREALRAKWQSRHAGNVVVHP